jgi:hypothetical protein
VAMIAILPAGGLPFAGTARFETEFFMFIFLKIIPDWIILTLILQRCTNVDVFAPSGVIQFSLLIV